MKAMVALLAGLGVPSGPPPLTFDTPDGSYSVANASHAEFTITASQSVVWTWSQSPAGASVNSTVFSGGTGTSITVSIDTTAGGGDKLATVTIHSNGHTWSVDLDAQDPNTI